MIIYFFLFNQESFFEPRLSYRRRKHDVINEVKVVRLSAAMLHHCRFASVAGKQLLPVNEKLYSVCITENCRSHRESPLCLEITEIQTSTGSKTTCSRGKQHLPRALRPQVEHRHVNVRDPVGRFRSTLSPSWLRLHMKAARQLFLRLTLRAL